MSNHKSVEFEGKIYPSRKALAHAHNVNLNTLKSVMFRQDLTVEMALKQMLGWLPPAELSVFELNKFATMRLVIKRRKL
jgi:hypothetical protein